MVWYSSVSTYVISGLLTLSGYNPFQSVGIIGAFLVGILPSSVMVIPSTLVLLPLYIVNPTTLQAEILFIMFATGLFVGNTILFFTSHHLHNIITKKNNRAEQVHDILYKYKYITFVLVPTMIFGVGDAVMIYAGIRHLHYGRIIPFLAIGCLIRSAWALAIVIYIPRLFNVN